MGVAGDFRNATFLEGQKKGVLDPPASPLGVAGMGI